MIEDIVDVQISIQDQAIDRASFGIGLILGSSGKLVSKIQEFANQTEVLAVFTAGDPEEVASGKYFGQDLKPVKVFIAQRDADEKQDQKIIITDLQNDTTYTVNLSTDGASPIAYSIVSDSSATRAEIVDALIIAIEAGTQADDVVLTDNGDDFDLEAAVAGFPLTITVSVNLSVTLLNANVNIETELADIEQLPDGDDYYALMSISHSDTDIKRAANFIQSRTKIYGASSDNADIISPERHVQTLDFDADFVTSNIIDIDVDGVPITTVPFNTDQATTLVDLATELQGNSEILTATVTGARQITITAENFDVLLVIDAIAVTGGASQAVGSTTTLIDPTTDLGAELNLLALDRTFLMYSGVADSQFPEAAWIGGRLPNDAGSQSWFGKTLIGITIDSLKSAQKKKALGNKVNTYTKVGSKNLTQNGTMASGRFIDVRRGVDQLTANMTEKIFTVIVNSLKIPYTDDGVALIENEMKAALEEGVDDDILRDDPAPTTTVPLVADADTNDRANRLLPDLAFDGELAGAIHKAVVRGVVAV